MRQTFEKEKKQHKKQIPFHPFLFHFGDVMLFCSSLLHSSLCNLSTSSSHHINQPSQKWLSECALLLYYCFPAFVTCRFGFYGKHGSTEHWTSIQPLIHCCYFLGVIQLDSDGITHIFYVMSSLLWGTLKPLFGKPLTLVRLKPLSLPSSGKTKPRSSK